MSTADCKQTKTSAVVIYTTQVCPYCVRAKSLLEQKGIAFEEIRVDADANKMQEMLVRSGGRRTVPQIFIGQRHIGGSDDLYTLERAGELDALLGID